MKKELRQFFVLIMLWGSFIASADAKSIHLTTYYPPPNGAFDQLRIIPQSGLTDPCIIGSMYHNAINKAIMYCINKGDGTGQWQLLKDSIWSLDASTIVATPSILDPKVFIGIGTILPEFKLTLEKDAGIVAKGTFGSGASLKSSGQGTYFLWYPRKAAIYRGTVTKDLDFGAGTQISTVSPHTWDDTLIGQYSVVAGGKNNAANYTYNAVGGGEDNLAGRSTNAAAQGNNNVIVGGLNNMAYLESGGGGGTAYSGILGGTNNKFGSQGGASNSNVILGGEQNQAGWQFAAVAGGILNYSRYNYAFIAGGSNNSASGPEYSSVVGGYFNAVNNSDSTIVGGKNNSISSGPMNGVAESNSVGANFIGGGENNHTAGYIATAVGGYGNYAINSGFILGGYQNQIIKYGNANETERQQSAYSSILGGANNFSWVYTGNVNTIMGGIKNTITNANQATDVSYSSTYGVSNKVSRGHVFAWGHGGDTNLPATADYYAIAAVPLALVDANVPDVFTIRTGRVGIGTATPTEKLHVNGNVRIDNGTFVLPNLSILAGASAVKRQLFTNIVGRDLAEVLHSDEKVEAGDLLSIADGEKIQKSNMAYDTKVIGIASTAPAIFLQNGKMEISAGNKLFSEGTEVPLALKGRTLCKVTSEGGPIKPGDLLTSSSLPGHAMKATDAQKSDHSIIGKALESFNPQDGTNSTGKIVILVTLQ